MRLIAAMNAIPDFSKVVKNRGPLPYLTVVVNSWAGQGFYDIDWGTILGGHCERIR